MGARLAAQAVPRVLLSVLLCGIVGACAARGTAFHEVNTDNFGVALKGYDPVAYFTEGRAVKGTSEFSYTWHDAKWHFASAANRDRFAADPQHFAPQYGGY
jgi:YHS domain-containing protein